MSSTSVLYQSKLTSKLQKGEFFPLSSLYFCEECDAIRCTRTVTMEPVIHYCPNCLFEVPTASVKSQRNRCMRNCSSCPICSSSLSTVGTGTSIEDNDIPLNMLTEPESSRADPPFVLSCGCCGWNTTSFGDKGVFEKPTGIGALIARGDEREGRANEEFDYIRDRLDSLFSVHSMIDDISIHPLYPSDGTQVETDRQLESIAESEEERLRVLKRASNLDSISNPSSNSYPMSMFKHLQTPQRVKLVTKYSKRCGICRHILIKPDTKSHIKHKIKMTANNYLPGINVKIARMALQPPGSRLTANGELRAGRVYVFEMQIINPLYDAMKIRMRVLNQNGCKVRIDENEYEIGAFNEVMEFEEEAWVQSQARRISEAKSVGLVESKGNSTRTMFELSVNGDAKCAEVILEVTYTYRTMTPPSSPQLDEAEDEYKDFTFNVLIDAGNIGLNE
ncbi:hypothetical protein WALSEDRAFT_60932 [Wallemia mellicola CBS 633.66]|uniref:Dynactin subunit 4 n=1 Tax=Wallemia mellicola (strain ATCC MYA-4683 / CBS 633.66) TaxID=671144 RepID=I4Y925_WALMC|nr:hypothetical protein WALSEDRAFT_60932 [Wallemia mellicola CBS 633.66]EIM20467.1 hypothetical protein WALSEDRAFT_60932 [Wallemia mellicola CBS 633.66]TIB92529.1 hypothetical protein E3Q19_01930 [Wallemia mellicola]|eukprot:XP_006959493.1 hypothetical protein WALSEDRAFT_60932 [Wallemia mellicola CBS 633.66]